MNDFLAEVLHTRGGERVLDCYQCGTCSGSCPVLSHMEFGPRQIMHMIRSGMEREVLSSPDIWYCVSCYSCASRCPRGVEVTDVMSSLRSLAMTKGHNRDSEAKFGVAFTETIAGHGRMWEPEVLARYYARTLDALSLLKLVPLGLKMLYKGKLPFSPERLQDTRTWRMIFTRGREDQPAIRTEQEGTSHG
jgi:heterodisulfide reductase subunit C